MTELLTVLAVYFGVAATDSMSTVKVPACSGVAVGPHAVLTAAHCVEGSNQTSWVERTASDSSLTKSFGAHCTSSFSSRNASADSSTAIGASTTTTLFATQAEAARTIQQWIAIARSDKRSRHVQTQQSASRRAMRAAIVLRLGPKTWTTSQSSAPLIRFQGRTSRPGTTMSTTRRMSRPISCKATGGPPSALAASTTGFGAARSRCRSNAPLETGITQTRTTFLRTAAGGQPPSPLSPKMEGSIVLTFRNTTRRTASR